MAEQNRICSDCLSPMVCLNREAPEQKENWVCPRCNPQCAVEIINDLQDQLMEAEAA